MALLGRGFALAVMLAVGAKAGVAQETPSATAPVLPNAMEGLALAQRLCAACHVVSEDQVGNVPAGVPSFSSLANRPGQTRERIVNSLIVPHPPMPDVQLARVEIDHLIAYLDTLRRPESGKPLLEEPAKEKDKKPEYPEQT